MNFAEAATHEASLTRTENGALALNTTGDARLDLYGSIGALRGADESRITRLFAEAWKVDPLFATKIVFYARDIRNGLGERDVFRTILRYMADNHPEAVRPNLDLIGVYGRYDDLYCLIGTKVENDMWMAMKRQFNEDILNMSHGNATSLLAKWLKTADASSQKTRFLGILTADRLNMSVYEYKRRVRALRKHIGVVESLMSAGKWDKIKYSEVPSRAMMIYHNAFQRHDEDRFNEYINKAVKGEVEIKASTIYPYDLIERYLETRYSPYRLDGLKYNAAIEAQWNALPDYVGQEANAIVIADTSGSMYGRPLFSAVGLAIYFAQRNRGAYHNLWMSFSNNSTVHVLKGDTLAQQLGSINTRDWDSNTNLEKAFVNILEIAIKNNVSPEDMVKSIIVISDMEIDYCTDDWTFYDLIYQVYKGAGYELPNVIFWNVCSRHDVFHADSERKGVQLASGQSASVFKNIMQCIGMTATEAMEAIINSDRYDPITIEK